MKGPTQVTDNKNEVRTEKRWETLFLSIHEIKIPPLGLEPYGPESFWDFKAGKFRLLMLILLHLYVP